MTKYGNNGTTTYITDLRILVRECLERNSIFYHLKIIADFETNTHTAVRDVFPECWRVYVVYHRCCQIVPKHRRTVDRVNGRGRNRFGNFKSS